MDLLTNFYFGTKLDSVVKVDFKEEFNSLGNI